jgi:hypothetical protein
MSSRHRLESLLEHPRIWRAGARPGSARQTLATGYRSLDQALAGGWPAASLNELCVDTWGIGELRLLLPALRELTAKPVTGPARWTILVNPPYLPYAPALSAAGIGLAHLLVTRCREQGEVHWAMEQALYSGHCAAVLGWCEAAEPRRLRRLQLAAEASRAWAVLFRPARFRRQRSPAALRMHLCPTQDRGIRIHIFKHRGGRPRQLVLHA